jgi:hypothetical protein
MDSLLQAVGDFIARNHMWAGVLLGLITFFESLAVVGCWIRSMSSSAAWSAR